MKSKDDGNPGHAVRFPDIGAQLDAVAHGNLDIRLGNDPVFPFRGFPLPAEHCAFIFFEGHRPLRSLVCPIYRFYILRLREYSSIFKSKSSWHIPVLITVIVKIISARSDAVTRGAGARASAWYSRLIPRKFARNPWNGSLPTASSPTAMWTAANLITLRYCWADDSAYGTATSNCCAANGMFAALFFAANLRHSNRQRYMANGIDRGAQI
jgi:hypothetical protein